MQGNVLRYEVVHLPLLNILGFWDRRFLTLFFFLFFFSMDRAESLLQSNGMVQGYKNYGTKLTGMPHKNIR